jgi:hypothetical protein
VLRPLWREVKHGFFKLTGIVLTLVALASWWAAKSGAIPADRAGSWSVRLALATLAIVGVSTLLLFVRQPAAGRVAGLMSVAVSTATLCVLAATGRQAYGVALFQLVAGAAFLGSVTDGLLLGHWYLTDRGLARAAIDRYTTAMLITIPVETVAVISGGFQGTGSSQAINPLLTAGALAPWIALGMVGTTLLIAVLTRAALKGERASAVQSATGFYYLAVVTAFTAELAVKTRFLAR